MSEQNNQTTKEKHFIVGAGGTGMRMLEAFVHQCAAGVYPNKEFYILSVDTDTQNANRTDFIALTDYYLKIKGADNATTSGLFSAKIIPYHYAAKYKGKSNLNLNEIIDKIKIDSEENKLLAELLLSSEVRSFPLDHGYRAQTQLGSLHMYVSILNSTHKTTYAKDALDEEEKIKEEDLILNGFLEEIKNADNNSKLFVMGSVFGGTGASSVPIVPKALKDAYGYIDQANKFKIDFSNTGCAILTDYFSFPMSANTDELVAKSDQFRMNSKLSLDYYKNNMENVYQQTFITGKYSKAMDKNEVYKPKEETDKPLTGGKSMDNPSHYLELISSASLYSFLKNDSSTKGSFYKTLKVSDTDVEFDFDTIINNCDGDLLEKGFSALFAMVIIAKLHETKGGIKDFATRDRINFDAQANYDDLMLYLNRFKKFYFDMFDNQDSFIELLNLKSFAEEHIGIVNQNEAYQYNEGLIRKSTKAYDQLIDLYDKLDRSNYQYISEEQNKVANSFYDMYNQLTNRNQ